MNGRNQQALDRAVYPGRADLLHICQPLPPQDRKNILRGRVPVRFESGSDTGDTQPIRVFLEMPLSLWVTASLCKKTTWLINISKISCTFA